MPCRRTLSLSGACALEDCETADQVPLTNGDYINEYSLQYAPDLCYCMCTSYQWPVTTTTRFYKYDEATNTLVQKATYAGDVPGRFTYDAKHQVFVGSTGATIVLFNPVTEAVTSFATGVTGAIFDLVYVPEKELTYGHIGEDGGGQHYIGYIDLDLQIAVQLGVIPAVGGSNPFGYNLVYSPVADAIYGAWISGVSQGLLKFDLASSTGSNIIGPVTGAECCWDSDQNYLVVCGANIFEWDTDIDALVRTSPCPAGYDLRWTPVYVSSMTKVFASGWQYPGGERVIASFNTDTAGFVKEKSDVPFQYYGICNFKDGSFISSAYDDGTARDGVRRLCLT